jgi:hypothetical protein
MKNIKFKHGSSTKNLLDRQNKALNDLLRYARKAGVLKSIPEPVEWQKAQRKSSNPWQECALGLSEK